MIMRITASFVEMPSSASAISCGMCANDMTQDSAEDTATRIITMAVVRVAVSKIEGRSYARFL